MGHYTDKPILQWWRDFMERRGYRYAQFGQPDDVSTYGGATGCTHSVLQTLVHGWTGKSLTHDQVSRIAGYPWPRNNHGRRGLRPSEVARVLHHFDLPYRFIGDPSKADMKAGADRGPVILPIHYGSWPNWRDYHNVHRPRPWARPYGHAGRNQFSGFYGPHSTLLLGFAGWHEGGEIIRTDAFDFEPNHGSPARPQRPPYDIVTTDQAWNAHQDLRSKDHWRSAYIFVPTRSFRPR